MISEQSLMTTLHVMLEKWYTVPTEKLKKIVEQLNALSEANNVQLSSYGYVLYVLEHAGLHGIYKNALAYPNLMKGYAEKARKYKEDMPVQLLNASKYVEGVFSQMVDQDLCMTRLEGMSFPYVLYVLFAGAGQEAMVSKYRPEIEEQLRRYPDTLALLPEQYKNIGEEVLNANAERG